jgi:PilZ domain-containing protein
MSDEFASSKGQEAAAAERREAQRYPFICPAELMELGGSMRISARTSDLSLHGCYIDTLNPFPKETRVQLQLTKNDQHLELQARVTACHMGSGMGLMFEQLTPEQSLIIAGWLEGTSVREENPFRTAPAANSTWDAAKANARFAASLVKVLERKGILTHSEAAELLRGLDS